MSTVVETVETVEAQATRRVGCLAQAVVATRLRDLAIRTPRLGAARGLTTALARTGRTHRAGRASGPRRLLPGRGAL